MFRRQVCFRETVVPVRPSPALRPVVLPLSVGAWVVFVCLWQLACSGGTQGPNLVDGSGAVTYQGQPLANAQVLLIPDLSSTKGARSARAVSNAEGHYQLGTLTDGDGVIPGKYLVAITARGPGKPIPADVNPGLDANEAFLPGPPLIPEKYFRTETSGLTAEVPPAGSASLNFVLP